MAIDFYDLLAPDKKLFEISQDDFNEIEFVFLHLREKTGVVIDPYGRSRIYRNHVELVISFMTEAINGSNSNKRKILFETIAKFETANQGFLTEGD